MKAIIVLPDTTRIEVEGSEQEVQRALDRFKPAPIQFVPYPAYVPYYPHAPIWGGSYTWTLADTKVSAEGDCGVLSASSVVGIG